MGISGFYLRPTTPAVHRAQRKSGVSTNQRAIVENRLSQTSTELLRLNRMVFCSKHDEELPFWDLEKEGYAADTNL